MALDNLYELNAGVGNGPGFGMPFGGGYGGGFGSPFGLFGLFGLLGGLCGDGFGRGRGGHDGGGGHGRSVDCWDLQILGKIGDIQAAIPTSTAALEAAIAASTNTTKDQLVALASAANQNSNQQLLATLQGVSTVKDSIQVAAVANAQQTNELASLIAAQGCATRATITDESQSIKALITANRIAELQDLLAEERHGRRSKENEINISNVLTNTSVQQQQQQQQQAQAQAIIDIQHRLGCFMNSFDQFQRQTASNINFGNGVAQAANPTQNQVGRI